MDPTIRMRIQTYTGWTTLDSGTGTSLDPGAAGYPTVDSSFSVNYDFAMSALAGLLPEVNKQYNQDKNGHFYAPGELIKRNFAITRPSFICRMLGVLLRTWSSPEVFATLFCSLHTK